MTVENSSKLVQNINTFQEDIKIHYFFIFNNAGMCLYARNYTNQYEMKDNLITAFCSALISFSLEMVGKQVKIIEMDQLKIIIIQRDDFFYGFLCDVHVNLLLLEDYVNKIDIRVRKFIKEKKINTNIQNVHHNTINKFIDNLVYNKDSFKENKSIEYSIIRYLNDFIHNNELEGLVLLNNRGKIVYSSLNSINLQNLLRELDFRIQICNNSILKLFYSSKNELIYSEYINDQYFIVLIFDIKKTTLGMAEYHLKKVIKNINSILLKHS
ncbi:MAG: hypothetical protein GF311_01880 [Candidatus Lokiarchaeota archaeon]|nr:hypothetical protein [Candidatus Lokiarchaeota archaeon]